MKEDLREGVGGASPRSEELDDFLIRAGDEDRLRLA